MNKMLGLDEYTNIAKKILFKNSIAKIAASIYNDPMQFGEIVSAVATADWKFNGKGNIHGYRKAMVQWTIYQILKKCKKNNQTISLDLLSNRSLSIKNKFCVNDIDNKDYIDWSIEKVKKSKKLTEIEKSLIIGKVFQNKTSKELAKELDLSISDVGQRFNKGLQKIGRSLCVS